MYVEIMWAHKYISQERSTYVIIIPLKCFCDQQTPSGTRKQLPNMPDDQNPPLSSLLLLYLLLLLILFLFLLLGWANFKIA